MGLFGKIFGGGDDYPPLQKDSPVLGRLRKDIKGLEELAGQMPERLEIVPAAKERMFLSANRRRNSALPG